METTDRYRLSFTHRRSGTGATTDEVIVERTDTVGPGGNPVYCDPTGILRAEISPAGEVRMLASGAYQAPTAPSAEPLP
ncbi:MULTISPECIES: DUF6296 family protein [unclassified Streptomyces]|uniref:DUF6296 family protein n=1 Tax=unclassified Streptomyces TaxID=2593676 RepID=UPI0022507327|nr:MULTISPECIES: DUF6296 family protein [unclassified Streptomyces]MCX5554908.1 DUF6296 family protein [Streptomyces sp. NBC_00038]WRZ25159.1 DUF6296 family protein [Streptomyces sp. NBC_00243]WTB43734.1 DUF6296 family protein [Streptomyces sp. NBC_00827]WUC08533.1 DUF6296 family protein [Streptomyces sp. NBC_00564]